MSLARLRRAMSSALLHGRVAALLLAVPILLRVASVQQVVALLTPRHSGERRPWREVERVRRATDRLNRQRVLRAYGPCLRRSLTLYYFLSRLGYPVRVALGADVRSGSLVAHAWLTLEGEPVLEPGAVERYTLMAEWGGV